MVLSKQILNGLKLILLIVSLASVQIGFSQNLVTGQVTEAASGQSLPGANIIIKGTEKGTQSNVDGFFTIQASKDDILLVSYLGFVDQEISIGQSTNLRISMVADIRNLEEIVITGYGSQKKSVVTGELVV